ncbi:MAG: manganese efflux pump MntP family protein [Desulfovibrio sp.]|nr:manganese efflux pump MntP family protein [Desulfovibrio sp.]
MSFQTVLFLALALSMDAFAVALAVGCALRRPGLRHYLRLSGTFGGLQWLMPLLGALLGATLRYYLESAAHWIAFLLLCWIGLNMLRQGLQARRGQSKQVSDIDPSKGVSLLMLGLATSLDALSVGFSFALLGESVFFPALIIGLTCALITALGLYLGQSLARFSRFNGYAEIFGGLVLLGLGVHVL